MRYVKARVDERSREAAYRIYVTDSLKIIGNLNMRYVDIFKPEETRTADEIIGGIKARLRQMKNTDKAGGE